MITIRFLVMKRVPRRTRNEVDSTDTSYEITVDEVQGDKRKEHEKKEEKYEYLTKRELSSERRS